MYWIPDENNIDKALMFQLLLGRACTSQGLAQPLVLYQVPKKAGGEGAQPGELIQTDQRVTSCDVMPSILTGGDWLGKQRLQLRDRQHLLAGVELLQHLLFAFFN